MCVFFVPFHSIAIWPPPTYFPHLIPPDAAPVSFASTQLPLRLRPPPVSASSRCVWLVSIYIISASDRRGHSTSEEDTCKSGAHLVGWQCEMLFPPQEMRITRVGAPNIPKIARPTRTVVSLPLFAPQPPTNLTAMSNEEQLPQVSDNLNPTRMYSRMYLRFQ